MTTLPTKTKRANDQSLALPFDQRVRADLAAVTQQWKTRVTEFGSYVDKTGAAGTSKAGVAIQVSKRIKSTFGAAYDEMDSAGMLIVIGLLSRLETIAAEGMERGESRQAIKVALYKAIKEMGEAYASTRGAFDHAE